MRAAATASVEAPLAKMTEPTTSTKQISTTKRKSVDHALTLLRPCCVDARSGRYAPRRQRNAMDATRAREREREREAAV